MVCPKGCPINSLSKKKSFGESSDHNSSQNRGKVVNAGTILAWKQIFKECLSKMDLS